MKKLPFVSSLEMMGTITVDCLTACPEKSATSGVEKIGVMSKVADPIFNLELTITEFSKQSKQQNVQIYLAV
jgi:hypothetical protein